MSTTTPWDENIKAFEKDVENNGYTDFLRNPTVNKTMFVGENDTTIAEYKELVKNRNWGDIWQYAIMDDGTGNPERFSLNTETSGNYIHCAYRLSQFEEHHKVSVKDLDYIMEIGCGYGCMNKVCRQAGFRGEYILFDLPVFSKLQEWYSDHSKNEYITDIDELLKIADPSNKSMFISTWALSEMPTNYRTKILTLAPKFSNILLAYQCFFERMDTEKYFEEWSEMQKKHTFVLKNTIDPNNRYLLGHNFYE